MMSNSLTFADVVDAADELSLDEQQELVEVVRKRIVERRRQELATHIDHARREFAAGKCSSAAPGELMKEILS